MKYKSCIVLVAIWLCGAAVTATGQDAVTAKKDGTAEIKKAIQSYVSAYSARDVAKLAAHWSPDGVYISRASGDQIVGREALVAEFTAIFAGENVPNLAVETESIDFISPNVALERGTAIVTRAEDDVVKSSYSAVYTKRDGTWLIDRITDEEIVVEVSNFDKLKALDWLVGEWADERNGIKVESTCSWTTHQNYLSRKFKVTNSDEVTSSGLQIIGWDPANNKIRSWLFDSNGSFVTGTWTQRDDTWLVQSVATLAEGGQGSYTSVFKPLGDGNYSWEKISRVIDGEMLPNVEEIIVNRK